MIVTLTFPILVCLSLVCHSFVGIHHTNLLINLIRVIPHSCYTSFGCPAFIKLSPLLIHYDNARLVPAARVAVAAYPY